MKTIGQKIKDQRERLGLTQRELADKTELTIRSICSYEADKAKPRGLNIKRLCRELDVSESYLTTPEIEDPEYGKEEAPFVDAARAMYGKRGGIDVQNLLEANKAYFAGGDVPTEDKELFFNAIMEAYVACRKDASEKFTPKKYRK